MFRQLAHLNIKMGMVPQDRSYRSRFSKAYKSMFEDLPNGQNAHGYLRDIIDAAQESHPHFWVNGEKYVFSEDVMGAAKILSESFKILIQVFIDDVTDQIKSVLQDFDKAYSAFEQFYVFELMLIENDARRFIVEAIKIDQEMQMIE